MSKYAALLLIFSLLLTNCGQNTYQIGERLYKAHCANCHLDQGEGLGALIPPLANSDYLAAHRDQLPCIVRYGLKDTITVNGKVFAEQMAGIDALNDIQLANVCNYVLQRFGNGQKPFSFEELEGILNGCGR